MHKESLLPPGSCPIWPRTVETSCSFSNTATSRMPSLMETPAGSKARFCSFNGLRKVPLTLVFGLCTRTADVTQCYTSAFRTMSLAEQSASARFKRHRSLGINSPSVCTSRRDRWKLLVRSPARRFQGAVSTKGNGCASISKEKEGTKYTLNPGSTRTQHRLRFNLTDGNSSSHVCSGSPSTSSFP